MSYSVINDCIKQSRLHILVGFKDHDTTILTATTNLTMNLGANGVTAGSTFYFPNVLAAQEATHTPTNAATLAMLKTYWDRIIDFQLVAMTKLISDLDVNFVNELVFDYIFAGHFLSTATLIN